MGVGRIHEYLKHAQAYFYYDYLGEREYKDCFSFSQVRNPWDKMVSDFFFRCRSPKDTEKWRNTRKWFVKNGLPEPTTNPRAGLFRLFVKALERGDLRPHNHWFATSRKFNLPDHFKSNVNQLDGLTDLHGNVLVNRILKLEDTEKEWKSIQSVIKEKTGLEPGPLPHVNKSNREHYRYYYDDESYNIILKLFKKDIEFFNYSF